MNYVSTPRRGHTKGRQRNYCCRERTIMDGIRFQFGLWISNTDRTNIPQITAYICRQDILNKRPYTTMDRKAVHKLIHLLFIAYDNII